MKQDLDKRTEAEDAKIKKVPTINTGGSPVSHVQKGMGRELREEGREGWCEVHGSVVGSKEDLLPATILYTYINVYGLFINTVWTMITIYT